MRAKEQWLWTAMITPFTDNGNKVDYDVLGDLLKRQESAGNGVFILGSTGEPLSLSDEEKKAVVHFTLGKKLAVPVMVGVPNFNLAQSMAWLNFCHGLGIDAYTTASPAYSKPGPQGQIEWFRKLFDAADAPVMLYNVPSRTGGSLFPEVAAALRQHKNFWAVKESSGGLEMYVDFAAAAPDIALYCGDDNILASAAPLGACGLVSVASNVWADACHSYTAECRAGTYRGQEWWIASKALFTTTSPVPLKALMHHKGLLPNGSVRLPLSTADLANLEGLNAADKQISEWHSLTQSRRKEKAA
jgi:4-hydroxy-tetrahydrodipicolinate synthase